MALRGAFALVLFLCLFLRQPCAVDVLKESSTSTVELLKESSTLDATMDADARRRLYTLVNQGAAGGTGAGGKGFQFQLSTPTWQELKSSDGIKFSARHNHASCLFTPIRCTVPECKLSKKPRLWVIGGKVEYYQMYNLLYSYKQADVWYSEPNPDVDPPIFIGGDWKQIKSMRGDYYAQNADVTQPGPIAPWYQRYGHSLTAYASKKDNKPDMMLLMGGFAPDPIDDIWVTEDGYTWTYHRPNEGAGGWSPRAWHASVVFNGTLYLMGGSPLNNEIWRLDDIWKVNRTTIPLTRTTYMSYTFQSRWTMLGHAAWAPMAGMNVLSQWYFSANETSGNSTERLVLIGGYGGFPSTNVKLYDGLRCRGDVWTSSNGSYWTLLSADGAPGSLPPRAWAGAAVLHQEGNVKLDPSQSAVDENGQSLAPRIYVVGGGYVGFSTKLTASQVGLKGLTDLQWSRDGITWTRVEYVQGAGSRGMADVFVSFYSSQEWALATVDGANQYLGMWGQTMFASNNSLLIIAGDKTGKGVIASTTWVSMSGIFCDKNGIPCGNAGTCGSGLSGCQCSGMSGEYCDMPPRA